MQSGPIFAALTLTLNLRFFPPFYIDFKGKAKLKWSGENMGPVSESLL